MPALRCCWNSQALSVPAPGRSRECEPSSRALPEEDQGGLGHFADILQLEVEELNAAGSGGLDTEARSTLAADIPLATTSAGPALNTAWRIALVAIGALATTAPGMVLDDFTITLPLLAIDGGGQQGPALTQPGRRGSFTEDERMSNPRDPKRTGDLTEKQTTVHC